MLQPGVYRYAVDQAPVNARLVIHDYISPTSGFLGGDQSRSAARECIKDDAAPVGTVQNGIGDQGDGFNGGMHG